MSESSGHIILVQAILAWIDAKTDLSKDMAILVSSPNTRAQGHPPIIGGSIPDVFACSNDHPLVLIGEAKTASDIETRQSRKQFTDYLEFLKTKQSGVLVIAVPWYCVNQTRSLIKSIQRKTSTQNVAICILDMLPG